MTDREISLLRNDIVRLQGALDYWKQSWNSLHRDKKQLEQELTQSKKLTYKYYGESEQLKIDKKYLEQELQKTREQLEKAEKLLFEHNNFLYKTSMVFSSSTAFDLCKEFELYREKYLKEKDKQGE